MNHVSTLYSIEASYFSSGLNEREERAKKKTDGETRLAHTI